MSDDLYATPFGTAYRFYMERPWLSRLVSFAAWGGDVGPYYDSMRAVGEAPPGATIVDAPVGHGPAFRALRPGQDVRYIGVDLSERQLAAARASAARRGVDVELVRGDFTALPLPDDSADVFLSYWGLHVVDDPAPAVREAIRVLKPGGRLVGAAFVAGPRLSRRLRVCPGSDAFGRPPSAEVLEEWLRRDLERVAVRTSGPMAFFSAEAARTAP